MSKCENCDKAITKKSPGLECNKCGKIVHGNQVCTNLSSKQLAALRNTENLEWTCEDCLKEAPPRKSLIVPEDDEEDEENINLHQLNDGRSNTVRKLLSDISIEVKKAVKTEIAVVNESLNSCCKKMNEIMETVDVFSKKVKELEKKNAYLSNKNTHLELKVDALEQYMTAIEQKQLNNILEVSGIPETEDENLQILGSKIATKICMDRNDISTVKRVRGRISKTGIIHIILKQEERVNQWLHAGRREIITLKELTASATDVETLETKIYIRRALTSFNKTLLWQTKQKLRDTYEYIWFQEGRVLIRKSDSDKPIVIRNNTDIGKYLEEINKSR